MKHTTKISLALLLALPLAACGENKAASSAVKDAVGSATAGIDAMKTELSKMTDGSMGEITKSIDELKSKASGLTGEKKTEVEGLIKNITSKKDEIMKMIGDVKGMSDGAGFAGMKDKITNAIPELKKMIEAAMAKLK